MQLLVLHFRFISCSGVICEVTWFRNRSGGLFKRKQMEVGARKIIKRQFWDPDRKISVSGGMDQHSNLGWRLGWDLLIHPTLDWYFSIWNSKWRWILLHQPSSNSVSVRFIPKSTFPMYSLAIKQRNTIQVIFQYTQLVTWQTDRIKTKLNH